MTTMEIFLKGSFLLLSLFCIQVILIQYRDYLNAKFKYRFYALRDDLAMLVLKGELNEDDRQYLVLRDAINYAIYASDHLSVHQHIRAMSSEVESEQNTFKITNDSIKLITIEYFITTIDLVRKNSWFEIKFFELLYHFNERKLGQDSCSIENHDHFLGSPKRALDKLDRSKERIMAM